MLIHVKEAPAHPTDDKINAGQFQPGHVVTIIEDGQQFGALDEGPHTFVFEAIGVDKADLDHLAEPETEQHSPVLGVAPSHPRIRAWRAKDIDSLKKVSRFPIAPDQVMDFTNAHFHVPPAPKKAGVIG